MALRRFQFPFVTTAQRTAVILNDRDVVFDTDTGYLYRGDGATAGGIIMQQQGPAGVGVPVGGTTGQVLAKTSGANYATAWTTIPTPKILQQVFSVVPAATGTTYKADADTTPVITDGSEVWSLAITPTNAANRIRLIGSALVEHASNSRRIALAVFRNSVCIGVVDGAGALLTPFSLSFNLSDIPGVTTAVTYSIRAFANNTGSWYVNSGATPRFNGMLAKNGVTVQEVAP